jgi:hypothetical protein
MKLSYDDARKNEATNPKVKIDIKAKSSYIITF